jgi:hypothetical protein
VIASGSVALSEGTLVQVAIVFDSAGDVMSLYQDGSFVGSAAWTQRVDDINDVNNWLGRSQYYNDEELTGQIHIGAGRGVRHAAVFALVALVVAPVCARRSISRDEKPGRAKR